MSDEGKTRTQEGATAVCVQRAPLEGPLPPSERNVTAVARNVAHDYGSENMTSLEAHCAFFDRDGDGYVSLFLGFSCGCSSLWCCCLQ
jgi:Caleosin related protein